MDSWSLEELFERFRRQGDARSFEEVFDRAAPELLRIARRLTRNRADAEDLVQATWLAAIERADSFDRSRRLQPWLVGILVRQAGLSRRREARSKALGDLDPVHESDPARPLEEREMTDLITRALAELSPAERAALLPVLLDGRSAGEIGRELGRSRNSVYVRVHRGLSRLRRLLAPGLGLGLLLESRALARIKTHVAERALGSAAAASGAPLVASLTFLGVVSVKKIAIAGIVVAACLASWTFVQSSNRESSEAAVVGGTALEPVVEPAASTTLIATAAAADERASIAAAPAPEPAPAGEPERYVLRAELRGASPQELEGTSFQVSGILGLGDPWQRSTDARPISGTPPATEIDVTGFFTEEEHSPPDGLELAVDHPRYMPETTEVQTREGKLRRGQDGRTELLFDCSIEMRAAAVITGRAYAPEGKDRERVLCAARVRTSDTDLPLASRAEWTRSGEIFRLRVASSGAYAVLVTNERSAPATCFVDAVVGEERSVGSVALDLGASVCGSVDVPVGSTARWQVSAWSVDASEEEQLAGSAVELVRWDGSRFRRLGARTRTDEGGAFCLTGFDDGTEVTLPPAFCDGGVSPVSWERSAAEVVRAHAPTTGIRLSVGYSTVRILFAGLDESVKQVPCISWIESQRMLSSRDCEPSGIRLGAPPGTAAAFKFTPPGRAQLELNVTFPAAGDELVKIVSFVPLAPAALTVAVKTSAGEPVEFAYIAWQEIDPVSFEEIRARAGELESARSATGEFRIDGLQPGLYSVSVHPGASSKSAAPLLSTARFDVELSAGEQHTENVVAAACGALEVRVARDDDDTADIALFVVDREEILVRFELSIPDKEGYRWSGNVLGTGVNRLTEPLAPGEYQLQIVRQDTQERILRTATIEAGKVTEVQVDLRRP